MIHVLFICLGNICRSPMAEAVFRKMVKDAGLEESIRVGSAGTGNWHIGEPPHEGTRNILKRYGIDAAGLRASQVGAKDFQEVDYMIAMDDQNMTNLAALAPADHEVVVKKLLDFVPECKETDVPDPYFTGNFEEVYGMVTEGCESLLKFIREREGL